MAYTQMSNIEKEVKEITKMEVTKRMNMEQKIRNQPGVVSSIRNNRGKTLRLYATTSWTGSFHTVPIGSVKVGERALFSHNGSKGALIYGQHTDVCNPAGYLLAWSISNGPLRCGPLSQVYYNGWETEALANLNCSGAESSAKDNRTKSSAQARIQDESGTFPLGAIVGSFS
ncbi:hypothetical protein KSS87_005368 [Heliosperma pusillum]|nr:hypothetical protein KSS87_006562 [Heliosperma pusillum]KAH9610544.1 hypothetical protein KSS87_005368 [Heliosperma pusillum]